VNDAQETVLKMLSQGITVNQALVNSSFKYQPSLANIINRLKSRGAEINEVKDGYVAVNFRKIKEQAA